MFYQLWMKGDDTYDKWYLYGVFVNLSTAIDVANIHSDDNIVKMFPVRASAYNLSNPIVITR